MTGHGKSQRIAIRRTLSEASRLIGEAAAVLDKAKALVVEPQQQRKIEVYTRSWFDAGPVIAQRPTAMAAYQEFCRVPGLVALSIETEGSGNDD